MRNFSAWTVLAFGLLLAIVAIVASYRPSPGPGVSTTSPKGQSTKKPEDKKNGTSITPSSSVEAASEAGREAYEKGYDVGQYDAKASPDGWTILSALSPLITGLLMAGIVVWQILVLRAQNKLTEKSANAAELAANVAKEALAESKQVALTARSDTDVGLKLTQQSADAATASAKTADLALKISQRARVRTILIQVGSLQEDGDFLVSAEYQNLGAVTAYITYWMACADLAFPLTPIYRDRPVEKFPLFPGDQHTVSVPNRMCQDGSAVRPSDDLLVLYGVVKYTDEFGGQYETGWARRWEPRANDFVVADQPGYNYAT